MDHVTVQQDHAQPNGKRAQEAEHQLASSSSVVQSEDVAELRACLVGQQDEIARLTSHIQELTSLVSSQQQVLLHLGKELETGAFSTMSTGSGMSASRA